MYFSNKWQGKPRGVAMALHHSSDPINLRKPLWHRTVYINQKVQISSKSPLPSFGKPAVPSLVGWAQFPCLGSKLIRLALGWENSRELPKYCQRKQGQTISWQENYINLSKEALLLVYLNSIRFQGLRMKGLWLTKHIFPLLC